MNIKIERAIGQLSQWWRYGTVTLLFLGFINVHPTVVYASETLVVTYGLLQASLPIADLETLAETGETSSSLQFYLSLSGLDPLVLRNLLTMELGASSTFMDGLLNSESGNQLLSQMSEVIHLPPDRPTIQVLKSESPTPSPTIDHQDTNQDANQDTNQDANQNANQDALRIALIQAASDRQVTLLEVLQQYPTSKVYLDAAKLIRFMNSLESPIVEEAR
ncbi:MAG: alpha/beta hydrolase [Elainella sp. Prado103]|nr:alpha/beta hydrolase [Elainella sp. Prado103]